MCRGEWFRTLGAPCHALRVRFGGAPGRKYDFYMGGGEVGGRIILRFLCIFTLVRYDPINIMYCHSHNHFIPVLVGHWIYWTFSVCVVVASPLRR